MVKVSAYVPVYNGASYIDQLLPALLRQTVAFDEIIIVDDCSVDGIQSKLEHYPVRSVRHSSHKGLASARNTGIKAANNEFVASFDVDCVPASDWLECCLPFFNDSTVVGVGGKLEEGGCLTHADEWRAIHLVQHFGDVTKAVEFLSGSNTLFRKSEINQCGLYNISYTRNHEDVDICERLRKRGGTLMYVADAKVQHIKKDTWYSVMRSCWGFRHRSYPCTITQLLFDIWQEAKHAVSILIQTIWQKRFHLVGYDMSYFFIQCLFTLQFFFSRKGIE